MIPTAREMALKYEREKADFLARDYSEQDAQESAMTSVRAWLLYNVIPVDSEDDPEDEELWDNINRIRDELYT